MEFRIVLRRKVEVLFEVRQSATEAPNNRAIYPRNLVNGAGVSHGD
jgi:hypothetical protein